ncbi:uncharacterized protein EURHEDRAFT_42817 [Aspergillus ruber CBS 135680]|uniref:Uncharacterized protein n=1 Tax=Aspergillus ruber (strain CBS 135680) TaxID=1388766 RepID=A0A017SG53_ASPRC|nr:uncharacterized protein EURHEDRAFT_42817 [Aspergillus ruber CBS 135680]EYE95968.1 hypothetical protein EURHEDRAFT_42817 [Aspergillus ruber CBS 135680]
MYHTYMFHRLTVKEPKQGKEKKRRHHGSTKNHCRKKESKRRKGMSRKQNQFRCNKLEATLSEGRKERKRSVASSTISSL